MDPRSDTARPDRYIAFLLALTALAVYGRTMCRSIYTGDDGDFLTAMATFGVPHPTGYPLFTLIGRLFLSALSPLVAEPAVRINLMTALFGAAAVGLFYRCAALLTIQRHWAAAAALVFAFSPTLWQQSLSCEVYTLTCLFLTLCLYLVTLWHRDPADTRPLRLLAFCYGLSLTNNMAMALFLPGFLAVVLLRRPALWREGGLLASLAALFFTPIAALYAYLPLMARGSSAPILWGDPRDLRSFWEHVSGAQYRAWMFTMPLAEWPQRLARYAGLAWREFGALFLWIAPAGLAALWGKRQAPGEPSPRRMAFGLTVYIHAATVVYATNYNITDIYVYFIPAYVTIALWIAVGAETVFAGLFERLWNRLRAAAPTRQRQTRLIATVAVSIPILQMSAHFQATDKSGNFLEADYVHNVLQSAPRDAIVLCGNNVIFSFWYYKWVRGERPDLVPLHTDLLLGGLLHNSYWYYRHIRRQWPQILDVYPERRVTDPQLVSGTYLRDVIRFALRTGRPVLYLADIYNDGKPVSVLAPRNEVLQVFDRVPWGIAERLYLKGSAPPAPEIVAINERLWSGCRVRDLSHWAFSDSLQGHIPAAYVFRQMELAALAEKVGRWEVALRAYQGVLQVLRSDAAEAGIARCQKALAAR